jgi:hypothetical protein
MLIAVSGPGGAWSSASVIRAWTATSRRASGVPGSS